MVGRALSDRVRGGGEIVREHAESQLGHSCTFIRHFGRRFLLKCVCAYAEKDSSHLRQRS